MEDITISVIIPIYNAEKFLKRSIESILHQTEKQLELILVDDGSTDNSGSICDNYAKKDNRIRVIHRENGGSSVARNTGLKVATGKYVSFIDADDYMDLKAYENIMNVICKFDPDCLDFGWRYISDCGVGEDNISRLPKNKVLDKSEIETKIIPPLINVAPQDNYFIYDFCVNKVYRLEIIQKNNILFDEKRRTWEDRGFVVEYLSRCKNFYSMDECYYNYVDVPNSLSRKYDLYFFDLILKNYKQYRGLFGEKYNFDSEYSVNYWCDLVEKMIYRSLKETHNMEKIEKNILRILSDETVVSWFKLRKPKNVFEATISRMVSQGDLNNVLYSYKKEMKRIEKREGKIYLKKLLKSIRKKISVRICK